MGSPHQWNDIQILRCLGMCSPFWESMPKEDKGTGVHGVKQTSWSKHSSSQEACWLWNCCMLLRWVLFQVVTPWQKVERTVTQTEPTLNQNNWNSNPVSWLISNRKINRAGSPNNMKSASCVFASLYSQAKDQSKPSPKLSTFQPPPLRPRCAFHDDIWLHDGDQAFFLTDESLSWNSWDSWEVLQNYLWWFLQLQKIWKPSGFHLFPAWKKKANDLAPPRKEWRNLAWTWEIQVNLFFWNQAPPVGSLCLLVLSLFLSTYSRYNHQTLEETTKNQPETAWSSLYSHYNKTTNQPQNAPGKKKSETPNHRLSPRHISPGRSCWLRWPFWWDRTAWASNVAKWRSGNRIFV